MAKKTHEEKITSLMENEQSPVIQLCEGIMQSEKKYDTLNDAQKITFGRSYEISAETLEEIRKLDSEQQRNIISYLSSSSVHIKTAFIFDSMDSKLSDTGMLKGELAHQTAIDPAIFVRGAKSGTLIIPTSTAAFFCDFVMSQSVAETFFGFPPEIMLPLNLGLLAYLLRGASESRFERANEILGKYKEYATLKKMTIDSRTIFDRIVEYSTDRGYGYACVDGCNFAKNDIVLAKKIEAHAKSDLGDTSALTEIEQRKQRVPLTLIAAAIIAGRLNTSPDYLLARDYTLHNRIYIPGRFITDDMADDASAREEVTDERIKRIIGTLLCMPHEKRILACGEMVAATI